MKIGEKIAKSRRDINLTQDQLAEILDVTRQTISKWESNLAYPETSKLIKLSRLLNVSCDYLLIDEKSSPTNTSIKGPDSYVAEWAKLYPVLGDYSSKVNSEEYRNLFTKMIKDMMNVYNYSLEDAVLVLKDLLYKAFLELQKEENNS